MSKFLVTPNAKRPASEAEECFYCKQSVGLPHADNCVLVSKKVKLRLTIEYVAIVPAHWDKDQIEFHRNESSWCRGNDLDEIVKESKKTNGCICDYSEVDYLKTLSMAFRDE
jgi:hypothetical protein